MTTAGVALRPGISVAAARRALAQAFRGNDLDSPDLDARVLAGYALGLDHAGVMSAGDRVLTDAEADALAALARRRLAREPVARIVGRKEFWGLELAVTPDVLVPRPETETIVEHALARTGRAAGGRAAGGREAGGRDAGGREATRVLDLGTGSGALLLALLSELPAAFGVATDVSLPALRVARANAQALGLAGRAAFLACDFGAALVGGFDLVVSNPPYIASREIAALAPEVREHDPRLALDGGRDGLAAYAAIAGDAQRLLAPGGTLVLELGIGQSREVADLLRQAGLEVMEPVADLAGIPRAISARRPI